MNEGRRRRRVADAQALLGNGPKVARRAGLRVVALSRWLVLLALVPLGAAALAAQPRPLTQSSAPLATIATLESGRMRREAGR